MEIVRKVAVVTGGATGIGAAVSRNFARKGYRVAVIYNKSENKADILLKDLNSDGELNAIAVKANVLSSTEINEAVAKVIGIFGRIDVLVNNAGIASSSLLIDMSDTEICDILNTDLRGVIYFARSAAPHVIETGGSIINISSIWGVKGAATECVYSAAKAGVIGFTKALSQELSYSGVRVNCVSPGVIDTDMNACFTRDEMQSVINDIPLKRMGSPDEIAEAVIYLAEAEYITGINLEVNGGFQ